MAAPNNLKQVASKLLKDKEAKEVEEKTEEVKKEKKEKKPELTFAELKQEKLKAHLAALSKAFGAGIISVANNCGYMEVPRLSTGVLTLDYALGGGWARGRLNLVCGERSSCKTRLALSSISEAQKRTVIGNSGKYLTECSAEEQMPFTCLFIDAEGTFSPSWAEKCGVDLSTLHISHPVSLEQSAEVLISAATSGAYDFIVLDSLAQLMVEDDIEAAADEKTFGTASAKKNNNTLKKLQALMNRAEQAGESVPTVLVINQLREKIGVPSYMPAHMKKYRPGGIAQEYVSSIIVETWAGKAEYFDEKKEYPAKIAFGFFVDKNKVSTPKIEGEFIMAIADSPSDEFKAGEILEGKVVWDYCMRFELLKPINGGYEFKGEVFKTQKAIWAKYFTDKANFAIVKRDVLTILCPKK